MAKVKREGRLPYAARGAGSADGGRGPPRRRSHRLRLKAAAQGSRQEPEISGEPPGTKQHRSSAGSGPGQYHQDSRLMRVSRRRFLAFGIAVSGRAAGDGPRFRFELLEERPALDLAPDHVGSCGCYRDRAGIYHLFADLLRAGNGSLEGWGTEIRYYRSTDLKAWEFVGVAAPRGRWRGRLRFSDLDWYGAGSPFPFVSYGRVYLFYSGREHGEGPKAPLLTSRLRSRIMLAAAEADRDGAPLWPFRKRGVAVDRGGPEAWDSLRLDHPCVVRRGDAVYLYYDGVGAGGGRESQRIGLATGVVGSRQFVRRANPLNGPAAGCAMPRVFLRGGRWHMFLQDLTGGSGTRWKHWASPDGIEWSLWNAELFEGAGPEPGRGGAALALVRGIDGEIVEPMTALATGFENGVLKLWAYRVRETF